MLHVARIEGEDLVFLITSPFQILKFSLKQLFSSENMQHATLKGYDYDD